MGRHPIMQQRQKRTARGCHGFPNASRITYMGPPWITPFESLPRYMTDKALVKKFVDIPTKAVTHIQKSAPGPPRLIAAATPAIFPIPTVDASAVDNTS